MKNIEKFLKNKKNRKLNTYLYKCLKKYVYNNFTKTMGNPTGTLKKSKGKFYKMNFI